MSFRQHIYFIGFLGILTLLFLFSVSCERAKTVKSPDQSIVLKVSLDGEGKPAFSIVHTGDLIIDSSPLGIIFNGGDLDFTQSLKQVGFSETIIDEKYTMLVGKQTKRRNHCTQAVYLLKI